MDEDCYEHNLGIMEKLQLIDISSEDDFLIASYLRDSLEDFRLSVVLENIDEHDGFKLFGTTDSREAENAAEILEQREQKLLLSESTESGSASSLRKSLAWDSAFFTSAGVLDPEELFIINKGFEKAEAHLLPVIQEDRCKWRYADSESTLDSDGFSIDSNQSTEVDLFEEIRASIQKSSIMSNVFRSGCKSEVGEARKQETHSLKKLDVISRKKVKSMPTSRRQTIYMQGSERIKEVVVRPQIVQHAERNGESNSSSLKPPEILGRMNLVSARQTKKISLGADLVKMENKTATSGSGKGLVVSKKSGLGNSCCSTSSTTSLKSSSSVSVTTSNDSSASCSPSGSASSFKSSSNSRRKTDSRISILAGSGSTSKTPLRCSLRGKNVLGNPVLSNHSSYESLASSIDGWSSESSTTSANQRSNCLEASFDTSTSRGAYLGNDATQALDLQSCRHDQLFDNLESHQTRFPNQCIEAVAGTGNASAKSVRNFKPSGLRMPSPKIGFFDEDKAMAPTVSGGLPFYFGAQSPLPNINGATNRKRPGKPQPARILPENGYTRPGSVQTGVLYPALSSIPGYAARNQELDKNSPKVSSTFAALRNFPGKTSSKIDTSPQLCRESCSKSRKVVDGGHDTRKPGLHSSLKEERKRTEGILKNEMGGESKEHVRTRASRIHPSKDEPLVHNEDITPTTKEHKRASGHPLENDSRSLHNNEKENFPSFEDHVNGLSRYFEIIDLNRDMVVELEGKRGRSHSRFGDNFTENDSAPIASSFSGDYLFSRHQVSPNVLSKTGPFSVLTTVEFMPSTRTPLADKNSALMEQIRSGL